MSRASEHPSAATNHADSVVTQYYPHHHCGGHVPVRLWCDALGTLEVIGVGPCSRCGYLTD